MQYKHVSDTGSQIWRSICTKTNMKSVLTKNNSCNEMLQASGSQHTFNVTHCLAQQRRFSNEKQKDLSGHSSSKILVTIWLFHFIQFLLLLWCRQFCSLRLHILDSSLDSIFCQHAAVKLDWWQAQVLCNIAVLDCQNLVNGLPLDPVSEYMTLSVTPEITSH